MSRTRRLSESDVVRTSEPAWWLIVVFTGVGLIAYGRTVVDFVAADLPSALVAILLFAGYAAPIVLLVYGLDLFEREPVPMCVIAFVWGAFVATTLAASANIAVFDILANAVSADFASRWGPAIVGATNEETLKALGVVALVLLARDQFDNAFDGFVYGALIGLGFQVAEDIVYARDASAGLGTTASLSAVLHTFLVRGLVAGLWSHMMFTAVCGLAIAYFVTAGTARSQRLAVALGGCTLAMALHFLWNSPLLAERADEATLALTAVVLVKGVPGFVCVGLLVVWALRADTQVYADALAPDVANGTLDQHDVVILCALSRRVTARSMAQLRGGRVARRAVRTLQRAQVDLAVARRFERADREVDVARTRVHEQRTVVTALCGDDFFTEAAREPAERPMAVAALALVALATVLLPLLAVPGLACAVVARRRARREARAVHWAAQGAVAGAMVLILVTAGLVVLNDAAIATESALGGATRSTGGLASGALREALADVRRGVPLRNITGLRVRGQFVSVEVLHHLTPRGARAAVAAVGGHVTGGVEGLVEADVPIDVLEGLERMRGIDFVRPPLRANVPTAARSISDAAGAEVVTKTNVSAWHAAGFRGAGVRIGIVDAFDRATWDAAAEHGEVPAPAGTFCQRSGRPCDAWESAAAHGVAVAEVVHDQAPGAQLYLATAASTSDLRDAVAWFVRNGVRVVTRSLTAEYDGPGDGTGPIASVVDDAVARGILWVNSVGNSGGDGVHRGSYWRGTWVDADKDGWLDFPDGRESLAFRCGFVNGFRWNDWGDLRTDYDVFVYDDEQAAELKAKGTDAQVHDRAPPIEHVKLRCNGRDDVDHLAIRLSASGSGTHGDVLEFMTNSGWVAHAVNEHSASGPVADSANAGTLSVGAVDPALGEAVAAYSARGPTNDERNKPDVVAPACLSVFTYGGEGSSCFDGTSAATPVVAGVAAVVLDAYPDTAPADLKRWILRSAVVDRGPTEVDNDYGAGELRLGVPPRTRGTRLGSS